MERFRAAEIRVPRPFEVGGTDNPVYSNHVVSGTVTPLSDYVGLANDDYNGAVYVYPNVYKTVSMRETYHQTDDGHGLAILMGMLRIAFTGSLVIGFPKSAYGAKVNYSTSSAQVFVSAHGTVDYSGSPLGLFTTIPRSTSEIGINVLNGSPVWIEVAIVGFQVY